MINEQITYLVEEFKIPFRDKYCPEDWKDWYHYILYHPESKIRLLYNLCFNGRPGVGYITETVLLTLPRYFLHSNASDPAQLETYGYARNIPWKEDEVEQAPFLFSGEDIFFTIENNDVLISASNRHAGISVDLRGTSGATPVYVPELAPYGNGFIGWGVIPWYGMKGEITIANKTIPVSDEWYGYHDRNFGRFYWGSIGWLWFVLNAQDNKNNQWTFVLHRSNNSSYTKVGAPILFVFRNNSLQKVFFGDTVQIEIEWKATDHLPPVIPGAMASIFSDRSVLMPQQWTIKAADEKNFIFLRMDVQTHVEMIVPDSERKQYTFLKELSGVAETMQYFNGNKTTCKKGFFYAEHVH